MGCCGGEDEKKEGMVQDRKCRDVLCLLIFILFWAGMFVICAFAVSEGSFDRLVYGTDSYGFTCGSKVVFRNKTIDLSQAKAQYYLNPLDLFNPLNIPYAKTVCVASCPGKDSTCPFKDLPCKQTKQFMCPYYMSSGQFYGRLPGVPDMETQWYAALITMQGNATDPSAVQFVSSIQSLNIPWVNNFLSTYSLGNPANGTVTGAYYQLRSQMPNGGPCFPVWMASIDYFNRCFPDVEDALQSTVAAVGAAANATMGGTALADSFNRLSDKFARYVGDISKGILIIVVAGLVGSVVISLVWLLILRYMAGFMAWFIIFAVNVALIGITLYCFSMAGLLGNNAVSSTVSQAFSHMPGNPTQLERETWKWIAIASAIVAGIVFLISLLMISRVRIAVACMKVASQAIGQMPLVLLFPLLPFLFEVGLIIYWVAITGLLYSAGDLTSHCRSTTSYTAFSFGNFTTLSLTGSASSSGNTTCYNGLPKDDMIAACGSDANCRLTYDWNNKLKYAFIYHFFGLLWTNQFIVGFSCVTVAGAIGSYYWSRGDSATMPRFPVLTALKNTTVYHLGSIAFGSFIIAVIMFIRYLLDYIDRKTKELQESNKLAEWLICCCKCCMWCLEQIVKFINRNAYIMVAVKGTGYCASAGRALKLLVGNALRILAINVVGDLLIFLGKLAVAAACGMIAFGLAQLDYYNNPAAYPDTYLFSPVLPVSLSILVAFIVAEIFFSVYEMAVDTIILAFCEDCEVNDGKPKHAPPLLMEALGLDANSGNTGKPMKA